MNAERVNCCSPPIFVGLGWDWSLNGGVRCITANHWIMDLRRLLLCGGLALAASLFVLTVSGTDLAASAPTFVSAKPIWPKGRETEKNLFVGFRAAFKAPTQGKVLLRATGATLYRVFLNGHFLGHGPARGPHGFFRVDEWDLTDKLQAGRERRRLRGGGLQRQQLLPARPALVPRRPKSSRTARSSPRPTATARPFIATILKERVQKVQRYSFQRPFSEVYRFTPG